MNAMGINLNSNVLFQVACPFLPGLQDSWQLDSVKGGSLSLVDHLQDSWQLDDAPTQGGMFEARTLPVPVMCCTCVTLPFYIWAVQHACIVVGSRTGFLTCAKHHLHDQQDFMWPCDM